MPHGNTAPAENDRLRVLIDGSGDICSIYLKSSGRESC